MYFSFLMENERETNSIWISAEGLLVRPQRNQRLLFLFLSVWRISKQRIYWVFALKEKLVFAFVINQVPRSKTRASQVMLVVKNLPLHDG